jgi:hypothetical protein
MRGSPALRSAVLVGIFIAVWVARNEARDALQFAQYGDYLVVMNLVQSDEPFPRWLIGTEMLRAAYRVSDALQGTTPLAFVLQASRGWYLVAGMAVLLAFPSWAAFMALTTPMLLHFGAGYSEYYPFVAPLFVATALGYVARRFDPLPPWAVGAGAALLVLFYVGFAPLALLVVLAAPPREARGWVQLIGAGAATGLVVSTALAGPTFLPMLWHDMNTGNLADYPEQDGWAMPGTPFFWPSRAVDQLPEFVAAISRGVGIGPMAAALVLSFRERRLAVLVGVYTVVSWFTIPRLGGLGDTDLYFQLYALAGLAIGRTIDAADERAASGSIEPAQG